MRGCARWLTLVWPQSSIFKYQQLAESKDDKYSHIPAAEREKVTAECAAADNWLLELQQKQVCTSPRGFPPHPPRPSRALAGAGPPAKDGRRRAPVRGDRRQASGA